MSGSIVQLIEPIETRNILTLYYSAFLTLTGLKWSLLLSLATIGLAAAAVWKDKHSRGIKGTDIRGVQYSAKGTYGTAEWLTKKDAQAEFEILPAGDARGVILGQIGKKGEQVVALPENTRLNRNIAVLGSPGTGKSRGYIRSAVFQAVKREESIIITDPKGELFTDMAKYIEEKGYEVKLFNLVQPERSHAWNCLKEVLHPDTGEVDDTRASEFATIVMENTGGISASNPFWDSGELNLLKAIILYVALQYQEAESNAQVRIFYRLLESLKLDSEQEKELENTFQISAATYSEKKAVLQQVREQSLLSKEEIEEIEKEIRKLVPPCTIAQVYHILITNSLEELDQRFQMLPKSNPAFLAYSIFQAGDDRVKPNFIQGLAIRLQLFQNKSLRRITSNEDIDLALPGKKPCAYFCIISDQSSAMRAISSLFFSFLFKDLAEAADREGPQNRIYVNMLLDEFPNLGTIPDFSVKIATVRSRKINISICLQAIGQIWQVYEKNMGNAILSCCDTHLFLGCNDPDTAAFISGRSGVASIAVVSKKDQQRFGGIEPIAKDYQYSIGEGKRAILTPDEVMRLPNEKAIIIVRGRNVMEVNKFDYALHPESNGGNMEQYPIRDFTLAQEKYRESDNDAFMQQAIGKTKPQAIEPQIEAISFEEFSGKTKRSPPKSSNTKRKNTIFDDI